MNELKKINKWIIFPDVLPNKRFNGYFTRDDISQIRGMFPIGQNIKFTDSQTPTPRNGFKLVGAETSGITPVKRAWVFERRDGTQIEMRTYDTKIEFRIYGIMTDWELLKDGFTAGLEFAYGVISKSDLTVSYCQFCNGTDNIYRWTGIYGLYASDNGSNQITISGDDNLSTLGFTATGTIIIGGTEITYTGITGKTFTGCSAVPSSPSVGDIIVQSPITTGFTNAQKYSVALAHDGRIHTRQESKKSVWNYSQLDDPFVWTTGATDGDGGAKEIEQGGAITAFGRDEKAIYCFKKRLIKILEFVANTDRIDVPRYRTLKPSDDKSATTGAIGQKSTFHSPNGILFVTEDKELLHLIREQDIDYPQLISISDAIRPTFQTGIHDDGTGIVFDNKVYYAYKQDSNSTYNDVVIVYDLIRKIWYPPFVGWNVNDWTIVNGKLHWHSATSPNTYEMIDEKTDETLGFTSILRTWAEDFGKPMLQKKTSHIYLEIYQLENTEITATILYDENGYSGISEYLLKANDDANNKFNSEAYNVYGANAFGQERFGSNPDFSGMKKYRYFLELKDNIEFFNISLQLSAEKAGVDFELIRFGYFLTVIFQQTAKRFLKGI